MLSYDEIFSRALNRINDPKELSLNENDFTEMYVERLHSVIGKPRVRKLFSSIVLDDDMQEIDFTLRNTVDEYSDKDFVINLFVIGVTIEWLQPQVDSLAQTIISYGTKEEKVMVNNYKTLVERLRNLKVEQNKLIRDYGYLYNSYISGE